MPGSNNEVVNSGSAVVINTMGEESGQKVIEREMKKFVKVPLKNGSSYISGKIVFTGGYSLFR